MSTRHEDRITLHTPGAVKFESGVEYLVDGVYHVAALTRISDARAEMIGWQLGTCACRRPRRIERSSSAFGTADARRSDK
ncbi:MAG: hypothetical protein GY910_05575 [bacterium]|nr:hypothetical protein [bacterium]